MLFSLCHSSPSSFSHSLSRCLPFTRCLSVSDTDSLSPLPASLVTFSLYSLVLGVTRSTVVLRPALTPLVLSDSHSVALFILSLSLLPTLIPHRWSLSLLLLISHLFSFVLPLTRWISRSSLVLSFTRVVHLLPLAHSL